MLSAGTLTAQDDYPKNNLRPGQLKKFALRCELRGDFYTALDFMEEYTKQVSDNPKSIYYLAELYRKSRKYDSAIVYYSSTYIENDKKFPLRKYHLGTLKMIKEEYQEAKELLYSFRRAYSGKNEKEYKRLARNYMIGCDSALKTDQPQLTTYVFNLGDSVNTNHIEFSPYPLSNDLILYGSLPIDSANVYKHSDGNAPVRELRLAKHGQHY
jgi:tetratricopeptide (TPR) repeat protein